MTEDQNNLPDISIEDKKDAIERIEADLSLRKKVDQVLNEKEVSRRDFLRMIGLTSGGIALGVLGANTSLVNEFLDNNPKTSFQKNNYVTGDLTDAPVDSGSTGSGGGTGSSYTLQEHEIEFENTGSEPINYYFKVAGSNTASSLPISSSSETSENTSNSEGSTSNETPSGLNVGINYYIWWGTGTHKDWLNETPTDPVLGAYSASDPDIIQQHINWFETYGIDWLSVSWWGPNGDEDRKLKNDIVPRLPDSIRFSILYETPGMLNRNENNKFDLDDPENREKLINDIEYLSDNYFGEPNYRKVNGKPVIYFYIAGDFRGDIEQAFQDMRDASDYGLYIVTDLIRFGPPLDPQIPIIEASDGVTSYNMYTPDETQHDDFVNNATDVYDIWEEELASRNTDFMPVVIPGYDDTELTHVNRDNPPLVATPDRFRRFSQEAAPYVSGDGNSLFITSFNEWYEGSVIEPSETHGTEYLEIYRNQFTE